MFAASAIAANTFLRSLFGCIFPLFATYMFNALGINYTLTLLGGIALLLVPMPIVFLLYGKKLRARSKMAPALDLKMGKRDEEAASSDDSASGSGNAGNGIVNREEGVEAPTDGSAQALRRRDERRMQAASRDGSMREGEKPD